MGQTQAVYDSERSCSWWDKYALKTEDDMFLVSREMVKSRIWNKKYKVEPIVSLLFTENPAYDGCFWPWGQYPTVFKSYNTIELTETGRRFGVLLHEFAHLLCYEVFPRLKDLHGQPFARCYAHLVNDFMGAAQASELMQAFDSKGVSR